MVEDYIVTLMNHYGDTITLFIENVVGSTEAIDVAESKMAEVSNEEWSVLDWMYR